MDRPDARDYLEGVPHDWAGLGLFTGFNDDFFMSLMFFISGLFVWSSLQRKGSASFVRDRLRRLGIPFLFATGMGVDGLPADWQGHCSVQKPMTVASLGTALGRAVREQAKSD